MCSLADPLANRLRLPFVARLGAARGEQTFKIFLATLPLFFGLLLMSYFTLLPEGEREESYGSSNSAGNGNSSYSSRPMYSSPVSKGAMHKQGQGQQGHTYKQVFDEETGHRSPAALTAGKNL
jgi:hypothetical protein